MPDSEPGSGHNDPDHDWKLMKTLRVPTGFPDFMQFHVKLLECTKCHGQMTQMASSPEAESIYTTPSCQAQTAPIQR